jgi:glycosyltransferase involved in cell wall biosynthesis
MTTIHVCVTGRNCGEHVKTTLRSILEQRGRGEGFDLEVEFTNDASDDDTLERADSLDYLNLLVQSNHVRFGGLANWYEMIHNASDDDVLFFAGADGDVVKEGALERVARLYDDPETWCTYGTYENSDGSLSHVPFEWDGRDVRDELHEFVWSPLTCRAWLAKKVLEEDLKVAGYFQWSAGDTALYVPIIEMAGPEHARFISEPWYVRRVHEGNDTTVDAALQYFCGWRSYGRPRYSRLRGRDDVPTRSAHKMKYGLIFHPDGDGNRSMPQGTQYGDTEPHGPKNKAMNEWMRAEVERSLACPQCQGMRRCGHS